MMFRSIAYKLKEDKGAVPVVESAFIYPLAFLVIFFLLLLSLIYWRANVDYANLRIEEVERFRGDLEETRLVDRPTKESGLLFHKREANRQTSVGAHIPFNSGGEVQIIQQVKSFVNESDWDLWHLQSLQAWLEEIKRGK